MQKFKISRTYHRIITRALKGDHKFHSSRCHIRITFEGAVDICGIDGMIIPKKKMDDIILPFINAVSIGVNLDDTIFKANPTFENIAKKLFDNIREQTFLITTLRIRVEDSKYKEVTDYEISY